jgi:hypothetical protein
LLVKLTFCDKFLLASCACLLSACEFFGLRSDQRLRVACELGQQVFDLLLESCDETDYGFKSLIIEAANG